MTKEQRAQEWQTVAQACARTTRAAPSKSGAIVFTLLSIFSLVIGVLGLAAPYLFEATKAQFKTLFILGWVLIGLAFLMALFAVVMIRAGRRAAARIETFAQAVQARQGRMLTGLELAQWLTQYWDDTYPQQSFLASSEVCRATFQMGGVPVLVDHTPDGYNMSQHQPNLWWARVSVVAGPYSNVHVNPEHPDVAPIYARGYAVKLGPGGLMAIGTSKVTSARLQYLDQIFDVATELVKLTKLIDAKTADSHGIPLLLAWDDAAIAAAHQAAAKQSSRLAIVFLVILVVITIGSWIASIAF